MDNQTLERPLHVIDLDESAPAEAGSAAKPATEGTGHSSLVIVQGTLAHFDTVSAGLAELTRKYKDVVFDVASTTGMAEAKLARAAIRDPRIAVGKAIAAGKAPLNELKRVLEAKGLEITNVLVELETPIQAQIKAEEERKAAEKEAREAAEREKAARVQNQLDAMRGAVVDAAGKSAEKILAMRETLVGSEITLEEYGDRAGEAQQVQAYAIAKLIELHATAVAQEAAQANLALVQKELADMRAANDAREAEARAVAAAAQAAEADRLATAAAKLEADRAAFAAEQRAAREAEEARAATARKAEDDRIAAERKAEQERIDEEQRLQREAAAAEQARLDQEAAAARAEADRVAEAARVEAVRIAEEARATEEAAQAAHQKVRNAAHELLAALQGAIPFIGYEGAGDQKAKEAAYAAVILATGEEA